MRKLFRDFSVMAWLCLSHLCVSKKKAKQLIQFIWIFSQFIEFRNLFSSSSHTLLSLTLISMLNVQSIFTCFSQSSLWKKMREVQFNFNSFFWVFYPIFPMATCNNLMKLCPLFVSPLCYVTDFNSLLTLYVCCCHILFNEKLLSASHYFPRFFFQILYFYCCSAARWKCTIYSQSLYYHEK
jgi:hypothetical protein